MLDLELYLEVDLGDLEALEDLYSGQRRSRGCLSYQVEERDRDISPAEKFHGTKMR